ncbi:phage holin family protein [Pedobacter suwonensis]|uniref:phage holin family protein n=1 Tax=Pedobacter suwonensis TaxID=332999 RepID=UPI00119F5B1D|nr:phage holin family protein [Pedobacter suwonensis]
MKFLNKMLAKFDYHSWAEFGQSLLPSSKYGWTVLSAGFSLSIFPFVDRVFGLDAYAFAVLILVFIAELTSGLIAASICKEAISSMKLSRFSFKVFYYLVLISLPYVMAESFKLHGKAAAAFMFDWLHLFLLAQIILENVVSILENLAVISGKDKTHWIAKIQQKFNNLIS